jgi:hypothetical protein
MPDALAALRQAAEAVRAQIPTGGLTLGERPATPPWRLGRGTSYAAAAA